MRFSSAIASLLIAVASAHSTHHHEQKVFSQDHLDELERKWGTDVSNSDAEFLSILIMPDSGDFLASQPSPTSRTHAA